MKPQHDKLKFYFSQFRSYYIGSTIAVLCILIFVILFAREMLGKKEIGLSLVFLNANYDESTYEQLQKKFLDILGVDEKTYTVDLELASQTPGVMLDEYDFGASEKIAASVSAKVLDLLIADASNFQHYAYSGACAALNNVLSEEQLEEYKEQIYYIDLAKAGDSQPATDIESMSRTLDMDEEEAKRQEKKDYFILPDPSLMEEPYPAGIVLSDSNFIKEYDLYSDTVCILGFANGSGRVGQAVKAFEYMYQ